MYVTRNYFGRSPWTPATGRPRLGQMCAVPTDMVSTGGAATQPGLPMAPAPMPQGPAPQPATSSGGSSGWITPIVIVGGIGLTIGVLALTKVI